MNPIHHWYLINDVLIWFCCCKKAGATNNDSETSLHFLTQSNWTHTFVPSVKKHVVPIHSVARMPSFSFLYLLNWPINHEPFTMDNRLNTWASLLYVIHEQALCFPVRDKNTLHISEMLQLQKAQKCTNVQSMFCSTIYLNCPNIVQMRWR